MIGARPDGTKELVALEDGFRESKDSWADLLRDVKKRGRARPRSRSTTARSASGPRCEQRCWLHEIANVLDKLPKSVQPNAKKMLHEAMNASTLAECNKTMNAFVETYEAKCPKAAASLVDAREQLVTSFDFPAEHWLHLRTTNPIESTFATVKLRQRVTKGAGSRAAGLAMAFELLLAAERRWRRLNGHEKLPLVRAGVRFQDGERDDAPASSPRPIARRGERRRRSRRRGRGRSPPDQPVIHNSCRYLADLSTVDFRTRVRGIARPRRNPGAAAA